MLKNFFKSIFSEKEPQEIIDERVNNFYTEQKWESLYFLLDSKESLSLSSEQYSFIAKSFISEIRENNYEGVFSKFFIRGPLNLKSDDFCELTKTSISEELKKYLVKEYLRKYSNLNIEVDLMEKVHPYETYAKYLIKNINSEETNTTIINNFKKALDSKNKLTEEEDFIYYLAAPSIAKTTNFSDLKENSNLSPKLIRNVFSQLHIANKIVEKKIIVKPIEIDLNNLGKYNFDKDILDSINNIINEHKKIVNIKYNLDGDDKFFLDRILSNYLPQTLNDYVKIHDNFRSKIVEGYTLSANDMLKETLFIYEKKITSIKNNIINEFKKRMNINKKYIQKLGDNLNHYQKGTYDMIDDEPFEAPEASLVKLFPQKKM